jgi:hypothetical protein
MNQFSIQFVNFINLIIQNLVLIFVNGGCDAVVAIIMYLSCRGERNGVRRVKSRPRFGCSSLKPSFLLDHPLLLFHCRWSLDIHILPKVRFGTWYQSRIVRPLSADDKTLATFVKLVFCSGFGKLISGLLLHKRLYPLAEYFST